MPGRLPRKPSRSRRFRPQESVREARTVRSAERFVIDLSGRTEELGEPILESLDGDVKTLGHLENVTRALLSARENLGIGDRADGAQVRVALAKLVVGRAADAEDLRGAGRATVSGGESLRDLLIGDL